MLWNPGCDILIIIETASELIVAHFKTQMIADINDGKTYPMMKCSQNDE
ncbi:MAG: hypothetical protein IPL32_10585 [Chloracidobacterium sp.]|nr:hypothetical protein [Chloracidobacterium sp.]